MYGGNLGTGPCAYAKSSLVLTCNPLTVAGNTCTEPEVNDVFSL